MQRTITYIYYLLSTAFFLLLSACGNEVLISDEPGGETPDENKVRVEIFARANTYGLPTTKALADENTVGMTPWVLVFKGTGSNAVFLEAVQAFEMSGKRYVLLSEQPTGNYQLLIFANPPQKYYYNTTEYTFATHFPTGLITNTTTLAQACTNLLTEPLTASVNIGIPYSNTGATIPMSYLLTGLTRIDSSTKIENTGPDNSLKLIRAVAKMVVINEASNFNFAGVSAIVNVPRQGRLHNLDNTIMDNAGNLTEYRGATGYSPLLVTASAQSTANTPIYLYESKAANNSYIIIKGRYENKDYYYKMAIVQTDLTPIDIQRNKEYTFKITKVKGPGFSTVADARLSKPSNVDLDYTIVVDNTNAYEIIANNDYYLAVSNSVFITYNNDAKVYNAFTVITDCETNFADRTITCSGGTPAGAFSVTSPGDEKIPIASGGTSPRVTDVSVSVNSTLNPSSTNAFVNLKLGNLEKQVRINRRASIEGGRTTLVFGPGSGSNENYYCLSATVDAAAKSWITLHPSTYNPSDGDRNDTDYIQVDDGVIQIVLSRNSTRALRNGTVYLTTIKNPNATPNGSTTQRIKIEITQKPEIINVK